MLDVEDPIIALSAWLDGPDNSSVAVLSGSGGTGKTRLAQEVCGYAASHGWIVGFADFDAPAALSSPDLSHATLIVVDYADEQTANVATLLKGIRSIRIDTRANPVRVLLLARRLGGWWDLLGEVKEPSHLPLGDGLLTTVEARKRLFDITWTSLSKLLMASPSTTLRRPRVLEDPNNSTFISPLIVQIAALALIQEVEQGEDSTALLSAGATEYLDAVIKREERHWQEDFAVPPRSAQRLLHSLRTLVVGGCLSEEPGEVEAVAIISALDPVLGPSECVDRLVWIRDRYGSSTSLLGPLRPDPIAERIVDRVIEEQPGLISKMWTTRPPTAKNAFTLLRQLNRGQHRPSTRAARSEALDQYLEEWWELAIDEARQTVVSTDIRDNLAGSILQALQDDPHPEIAARIELRTPHSLVLEKLTGEIRSEALRHFAPSSPRVLSPQFAYSLDHMAISLSYSGKHRAGLKISARAVKTYRKLYKSGRKDNPDLRPIETSNEDVGFLPELILSLSNHAQRLMDIGRHRRAIPFLREALNLTTGLGQAYGRVYRDRVLGVYEKLATCYVHQDDLVKALAYSKQGVDISAKWEEEAELATEYQDIATMYNVHARVLVHMGEVQNALSYAERALRIRRKLAIISEDMFLEDLPVTYFNYSSMLLGAERRLEALAAVEEGLGVLERLIAHSPARFNHMMAPWVRRRQEIYVDLVSRGELDPDGTVPGGEAER
jgi:tetratricopeptide (TPR) repeat protein